MRKFSEFEIAKDLEAANGTVTKAAGILGDAKRYRVTPDALDDAVRAIQRRSNFPLKGKVIADLDSGAVVPVSLPADRAGDLPAFLPFVTAQVGSDVVSFVNLTRMMRETKAGAMEVEPRSLFGMLQCGVIGREFVSRWQPVSSNPTVIRSMSIIYSRMMSKVVEKLYGVSGDQPSADQAAYAFAKFFMVYCLERPPGDSVDSYALKACPFKTTETTVRQVDNYVQDYSDPDGFYKGIAAGVPRLRNITRKATIGNFATMYGTTAFLSVEMPHYLAANVCAAVVGAGINEEGRFELVAGEEAAHLYAELSRIIR
jgi:hypothetical protein